MSWRTVVITGTAKLDYKLDFLVVRKQDQLSKIYIGEIALLIVQSTSVSITTTLLSELIKKKVRVIFCDEKHNPESELHPYYGSYDASFKVRQQIDWSVDIKNSVWTKIIYQKIFNQMHHLHFRGYVGQAKMLENYLTVLEPGDESNREGHAAKVYFNAVFGMDFTRDDQNNINSALNYGYSIILSCFNREIVRNGYLTQLGLSHGNRFNFFNLSSDLMEPYRPLVDKRVLSCLGNFSIKEKLFLVDLLNDSIVVDGKKNTVLNAIKIYCKSIFDALNYEDVSLIKNYIYEL